MANLRKEWVYLSSEFKIIGGNKMHIAIAGNIGSGKTTLTNLLAKHYGWEPKFEDVDFNPYLSDFYNDMRRWSFNVQVYFLNRRFEDVVAIRNSEKNVIQDRTIYEDARIFAPNLHSMGLMDSRDFENYSSLFNLMTSLVKAPDLIIYLKSSIPNLVAQIQKRGREYESSIRIDYLKGLNDRYEEWIENYKDGPLMIVNVDELKFEENPDHLNQIIDRIDAQLYGLF
jgi:deoxyadenosine/deoxycytidine kinase